TTSRAAPTSERRYLGEVNVCALGARPGTARLSRAVADHDGSWTLAPGSDDHMLEVRVETLDAYRERKGLRINIVKIDAEGAEAQVIAGACETLARDRPTLMLEVIPSVLERFGIGVRDLQMALDQH